MLYGTLIHRSAWNRNSRKLATPSNTQATPNIVHINEVLTLTSLLSCSRYITGRGYRPPHPTGAKEGAMRRRLSVLVAMVVMLTMTLASTGMAWSRPAIKGIGL